MVVIGERQVTGGNGMNPSGRKVLMLWIGGLFGSLISVGAGQ
jgi:hypothetical protein